MKEGASAEKQVWYFEQEQWLGVMKTSPRSIQNIRTLKKVAAFKALS